jgi:hypothetical protein
MKRVLGPDLSKVAILAVILLVLLSCNFPGLKPTPDFDATSVVRTVSARRTQDASDWATASAHTPTPEGLTSTPTATGTQILATATATEEPCENRARFIIDVTIPDGTYLAPGTEFEKVWRLLNAGTCPWTTEYALVFDSGNIMGGDPVVFLSTSVSPGITVDLAVDLIAPMTEDSYEGNWLLRNDLGVLFGLGIQADKNFWVRINVGSTPTPTSTATETPTPTATATPTETQEP